MWLEAEGRRKRHRHRMKGLSVLAAVVVVLMLHAWGGSAVSVSPMVSCNPDCDGVAVGDQVVNPKNCSEFFYCNNGNAYGPNPCEGDSHFDVEAGACVAGTECESICGPGGNCHLTCYENLAIIGDAFDCNVYYICTPEGPVAGNCPSDRPYYDGDSEGCVNDDSVCCSGYCQPYCDGIASVVPDPTDCTKFYFCDGEGIPEDSFTCADNGYFDVQLGNCVSGPVPDPCPTLCDGNDGGGGGTDECVSSLACTETGYFPACPTCESVYFYCSGAGASGVLDRCPDGYVFNTNPLYPICVLESDCPYTPPKHPLTPFPSLRLPYP